MSRYRVNFNPVIAQLWISTTGLRNPMISSNTTQKCLMTFWVSDILFSNLQVSGILFSKLQVFVILVSNLQTQSFDHQIFYHKPICTCTCPYIQMHKNYTKLLSDQKSQELHKITWSTTHAFLAIPGKLKWLTLFFTFPLLSCIQCQWY